MLGAVGNLAAFGLTEVGKQQLLRLINKNNTGLKSWPTLSAKIKTTELSPKDLEIIQNILPNSFSDKVAVPTTNVIGSGIKRF